MSIFESIVLGALEGATEFLPISSTGHLILASSLLGLEQTAFLKSFEILIQCGAILAVVMLCWKSLCNTRILKKIIVAFVPTGIAGLLLYPIVKTNLLGNIPIVLWALGIGGIALILLEMWHKKRKEGAGELQDITYSQSLFIGLFQSLSIIPGVSRAGATIAGGLLLGLNRVAIVEFSFLLAIPTMLAATGYDIFKNIEIFTWNNSLLLFFGFLTSFIVAIFAVKWLLYFIQTHSFTAFGIYRIMLAALFLLFII